MDKVWILRQKSKFKFIIKRKQVSLIFGKPISYGDKIQKEILTSLGAKPQKKDELVDNFLKNIQKKTYY